MAQIKQFGYDDETGEVISYEVNDETGEPCLENRTPNQFDGDVRVTQTPQVVATCFPQHGYMCKTKKFQMLKAKILSGSNTLSHRMLLLPTLMICPAVVCSILAVLEVYLHIRCHKKNRKLEDPSVYYRSPFHILSSMFCGVCRDINSASKIGQLQDKRRNRYDYLSGIAI